MTTQTRNEAAERLLDQLISEYRMTNADKTVLLADALAAERRATVERLREQYEVEDAYAWEDQADLGGRVSEAKLLAILDEEAAR